MNCNQNESKPDANNVYMQATLRDGYDTIHGSLAVIKGNYQEKTPDN